MFDSFRSMMSIFGGLMAMLGMGHLQDLRGLGGIVPRTDPPDKKPE